ncbi:MAG: SDR family oxidoreductase [Phycisphaera sp. TMED9]|jgi:3-oxoacyl-[acyl-carrier protein] reductase|nr:MAG: SDR family oxidoreductase [Phycisphaera sp. TMED9]
MTTPDAREEQPRADDQFSLAGRTALVTGSTTGLGLAIAKSLGAAGAKVALNYFNNQSRGEAAFAEYLATGAEGHLVRGSVIEAADVRRMVEEVEASLGGIDILVVSATPDQPHHPIEEYDWAFHQSMIDYFVKSPYLLARAVLPRMKDRRWGRIINLGSEVLTRGVGNFSPYLAGKGGQNGWNRSMATELAPWGITVNMVSPGWIPVERHEKDPQSEKDEYLAQIPMGRWGVPQDVGGTVTFLAGDAASFVTGQNIHVNGGMTVH